MTRRARARATCRPATGRSAPCSTCRSPSSRARPWRSLGPNGVGKTTVARVATGLVAPDRRDGARRRRRPDRGAGRTGSPGPASPTRPRAARCSPRSRVEENLALSFRRVAGPARACRAAPRRGLRAVPGARRAPARSWPARCRAASSGCWRWPGCWSRRRSCWSPTSCRSAWRRSSSTRSTRASPASASAGTALLIVEQHVGHALALCDRVVRARPRVPWPGRAPRRSRRAGPASDIFDPAAP